MLLAQELPLLLVRGAVKTAACRVLTFEMCLIGDVNLFGVSQFESFRPRFGSKIDSRFRRFSNQMILDSKMNGA